MNNKTDKTNARDIFTVEDILRGTAHALTIFKAKAIAGLTIFVKRGKPYLTCYATGKDRPAKPEEIVRQLYVRMLMEDYGYPAERIAIEKPVQFGLAVHEKAADVVDPEGTGANLPDYDAYSSFGRIQMVVPASLPSDSEQIVAYRAVWGRISLVLALFLLGLRPRAKIPALRWSKEQQESWHTGRSGGLYGPRIDPISGCGRGP